MTREVITVLQAENVRVHGTVLLPTRAPQAPVRTAAAPQAPSHAPASPQQARVVESNTEYAILEVVCSCGAKMHIQCNYGNVAKNA
ncbi:MAG: hypothetical protein JW828_16135 [Sedimentisphaerales bacterium]|nr:hypothetical protein [Sedimentisphaerales bacterium]